MDGRLIDGRLIIDNWQSANLQSAIVNRQCSCLQPLDASDPFFLESKLSVEIASKVIRREYIEREHSEATRRRPLFSVSDQSAPHTLPGNVGCHDDVCNVAGFPIAVIIVSRREVNEAERVATIIFSHEESRVRAGFVERFRQNGAVTFHHR